MKISSLIVVVPLFSIALVLGIAHPAVAEKGGKGGAKDTEPTIQVTFRDAVGDAITSDAALAGGSNVYVEGQDGLNAWMELEAKFTYPTSALTTPDSTTRQIWIKGPNCDSDSSCSNPFSADGQYFILDQIKVFYASAPSPGQQVPADVLVMGYTSAAETERLAFKLLANLDDISLSPTVTGVDSDLDGVTDALIVDVPAAATTDTVTLTYYNVFTKGKNTWHEPTGTDYLGVWTGMPFGVTFSAVSN